MGIKLSFLLWSCRDHQTLLAENKPCSTRALDWASGKGHIEIFKLLLAADKPYSILTFDYACEGGHIEVVKLLSLLRYGF